MTKFLDFLNLLIGLAIIITKQPAECLVAIQTHIQIFNSSRRIGLRDKGESENGAYLCGMCDTPLRIGVSTTNQAHEYCWRCEKKIDDDEGGGGPDGGHTKPKEHEGGNNVVSLPHHSHQKVA